MAYNNYFPQFYPSTQPQFMPQSNAQNQTNNLVWVQGENSAKSYPVGAGQSILLMDSENPVMYIKSTDQSGMPLPLRIFDYQERSQARTERSQTVAEPKVEYVSRDEFEAFRDEIKGEIRQTVTSTPKTTSNSVQSKASSKEK